MDNKHLDWNFATSGENELRSAIELYGQHLLRYCHNVLCDYADAQDAVQITFIKAYNKRKTFRSGTSLIAWLYRIAYTTCIDILRKKKFMIIMPQIQTKTNTPMEDEQIGDDLKAALLKLTATERALVFSRVIDEKSYSDLEAIYHVSASTLRKRFERAKTKLAKALVETNSYYLRMEDRR